MLHPQKPTYSGRSTTAAWRHEPPSTRARCVDLSSPPIWFILLKNLIKESLMHGSAATFAIVVFGAATFAGAALAQNAGSDAAPSPSVRLITLGTTAGPLPRKDRAQFSNALIVNATPYLIDAGYGVEGRLVQAGIDFTKIRRVFITHNHGDPTMGIPNLISIEWQYARREPVVFYGPPGTEETIKAAVVFVNVDAAIRLSE